MAHITRTQMIQIQSHYENGKTVDELASMIADTPARIIALLGDKYKAPKAKAKSAKKETASAQEENWGE